MKLPLPVIGLHLLAWGAFFLYEWLFKQCVVTGQREYVLELKFVAVRVAVLMLTVYSVLGVLVPRLLDQGRKAAFAVATGGAIVLAAVLMRTLNLYLVLAPLPSLPPGASTEIFTVLGLAVYIGNITFNVCFVLMFYFVRGWSRQQRRSQELEAAMRQAELSLLKSQVQPHFIFNAINNLYALAQKNSPHTADMIYRFSNLLDYMLYDSQQAWISLDKELSYIRNYIALEEVRYGRRLDVALNTYDAPGHWLIPSLTLLPFVENAFKHGLSQQTGPCWLRLDVAEVNGWLHVKIENSLPEEETLPAPGRPRGGLGLDNIRKRLDILYGPHRYELRLLRDADSYLVVLKLQPDPVFLTPLHEQPAPQVEVLGR
ncbi:sensor histidine kinase [Hymenobacter sp. HD11105]